MKVFRFFNKKIHFFLSLYSRSPRYGEGFFPTVFPEKMKRKTPLKNFDDVKPLEKISKSS
jgi:hypothetical protein